MPITPGLLGRLRCLDDLEELAAALGYQPRGEELGPEARVRLGVDLADIGVRRLAVVARHERFLVYGALLEAASRPAVARLVERIARHTVERFLVLALDAPGQVLACAAPTPCLPGTRARQLHVPTGSPSRIAVEILGGLAPRDGERPLALAARTADVLAEEGLTARFFREFARLHLRSAEALEGAHRCSTAERRDLALVFLTRVLFLYFVQAKGWLAGRSDFLPSLLDLALARGHPFHRSVFEPLCFGALSTPPGSRSGTARALGAVPFLNGGLFERHALERRFAAAALPDHTWRELFDDLFERFHFTVRESDQGDAVDPEMLGRVFEGLMAREQRRDRGTYFTPRPVLRRLVGETMEAALAGARAHELRRVRVLDPAVGSGAFLLEVLAWLDRRLVETGDRGHPAERRRAVVRDSLFGVDTDPMAVRLAELRLWLAIVADDDSPWDRVLPLPNLDQNLRQGDSLLSPLDSGAMRAPGAAPHVRAVAEARSLYFAATGRRKAALVRVIRGHERAVASAGAAAELALLERRLSDAAAASGRDLFGRRARRSSPLHRAVHAWRQRRRELRVMAKRIRDDDAIPFFSYDVHFGSILADGGFDVVIGNPPWVRGERLGVEYRARLAARYPTFRATGRRRGFAHLPDLSVAFVERGLELLADGGVTGMLLPAKLLRAGYAGPLRSMLLERATVLSVSDHAHAAHGFAATVFPMTLVLRKTAPAPLAALRLGDAPAGGTARGSTVLQRDLALDPHCPRAPWVALPGDQVAALRAMLAAGPRLRERFRPRLGVKTGANCVFLRDASRACELPGQHRVPALLGRDLSPFRAAASGVILAALDRAGRPLRAVAPEVAAHLAPHSVLLRRRADAGNAPLWALFRTDLIGPRWLVLWRDIASRLEASALERAHAAAPIPLNTCYGVAVPDAFTAHWLAAWLNSRIVGAAARALAERASGGAFRFSGSVVGAMPLPRRTDAPAVRSLARFGESAHGGADWSPDELDSLVGAALALPAGITRSLVRLDEDLRRGAERDR